MSNQSDLAGSGEQSKASVGAVEAELKRLEQDLAKAEADFRQASTAGDVNAMVQAHNRVCQVVASLSVIWSGQQEPPVFANYYQHSQPVASPAPPPDDAAASAADKPQPTIAELEAEIGALAQKMQKCLESGDMDGMLKCNELMGKLSEMIAKQEAIVKAVPAEKPKGSGAWSAGDTLALARQRAEERKKERWSEAAKADEKSFDGFLRETSPEGLREKLEEQNFYETLSLTSTASFEELHKSFIKKVRRAHRKLHTKQIEFWQFQEFVNAFCLAHDVLKYPNARLQYDLVLFGPGEHAAAEASKQKLMPLKELLKFSTLISGKDLSEAVEACKGQPEREMGQFLMQRGLLSEEEFDSILFGQKLVSIGKLTVAQFELAMQEMRDSSIPFFDTLVASEWIQPQDILSPELLGG